MNRLLKSIFAPDDKAGFMPSVIAILIGLAAGFVFMLVANPNGAVDGFLTLLTRGSRDIRVIGDVLFYSTPILMTGLSFAFANKTGLFNIGASGQFKCGAAAAIFVALNADFLPGPLHWIGAVLAGMLAGALIGAIPGLLKAFFNVNEVISCIMMNYISMYAVMQFVRQNFYDFLNNHSLSVVVHGPTAVLPSAGLNNIFKVGNRWAAVDSGIIIAICIAVFLYILLEKTTFGYELKACGLNRDAAKYAGINEKRSIIMSMLIAGAAAGIGGALMHLSGTGIGEGIRIEVVERLAPEGFAGIPVALLAMSNPIAIVFTSFFVAYLQIGGAAMLGFAPQIVEIIVSIIIYFSAFALVFRNIIRSFFTKKSRKKSGEGGIS